MYMTRSRAIRSRHTPRKRGIQYAAASRIHRRRLWNTGSPAFAGDDNLDMTSRSRRPQRPEFCSYFPPSPNRGRRECRAADAPAVSCAKVVVECTRAYRSHRNHPTFPAQWFYGLYVLSPVLRAFWPPSPALLIANLTPASGCQDHTTYPSASGALVLSAIRVHRILPRVSDVGQRPSSGTGRLRI
jgi:hypothetical protein